MYEVGRECKASIFRVIIFDISILRLKFDDKFVNMDIGPWSPKNNDHKSEAFGWSPLFEK